MAEIEDSAMLECDNFITDFDYPSDDYDYIGDIKASLKRILDECRQDRNSAPEGTAINRYMTLFVETIESELSELL